MKASAQFILVFLACLSWQSWVQAQTITTGTIAGSPFCPGATVAVPFTLSGVSIGPGNVFTAELSDAAGSFASPVSIGTGTPPAINATIPIGTPAGTGYRIRVTSSNQPVTGSPNTTNLTIGSSTINVTGNSIPIIDGDVTPSLADFTDFGSTTVGSNIVRTFTITNSGPSGLTVSSITVSGANASMFTVSTLTPASPIAAGGSSTFSVTFLPTAAGTKTATININNSSCNVAVYDFAVQGNATVPTINTLTSQGFENSVCDTWTSTGVTLSNEVARTGTGSGRVGRCGESAVGTFAPINTTGYAGLQFTLYHSLGQGPGSGPGLDTREGVVVQVQENNGAWVTIGQAGGNNNTAWGWNAIGGGTNTCPQTFTMPNPLVYNLTAGTTSFRFRIITINQGNSGSGSSCSAGCGSSASTCCANFANQMNAADPSTSAKVYDRSDEGFCIDDIKLTTTSPMPVTLTSAVGTNAQSTCINTPITNITYFVAGGGSATVTGLPTGVTGTYSNGIFTISGAPTTTVGSPFTYTVTSTCTGETATGVITVKPTPTITLTSAAGTSAQTICTNTAMTIITYSIGGSGTGAGITGLPTGLTGAYNAGVFTISGTPTATGTFNYTVTTTGPCLPQATATGTIIVKPDATITLTSAASTNAQLLCINTALTNIAYSIGGSGTGAGVTGLPAGLVGTYNTGVFTISGTPTVTGTFNYTVTTTGTCVQATAIGTVTVNPDATVTLTSAANTNAQTLCTSRAIANITYSISGGGTGANVTGLPAGVIGVYNAGVFTISGAPTATGTFNYTVTTTGTCAQVTATGTIIVNPDAAIALISAANAQTLCINTAIASITYAINGGGTGASITGLPAGVTGAYNAGVFTISGTPSALGTFNYTVTTTGTCAQATATGTISVTPNATISLTSAAGTSSQAVCINTAIASITYSISGGGTNANITGLPAGVTGVYNAGVFTISGTPTATGIFNYTVSTTGSCGQTTATGSITVNPDATIVLASSTNTDAQALCINTAIINITYTITGGGTGAIVTGLPAGLVGAYNAGVFTISGTPTATGTFNYTVTTTGTCTQATATGTVTVNPDATVTLTTAANTTAQTVCINTAITNIAYTVGGGGTGANVTGLPTGIAGVFNAGVFTISGTPIVAGSFNYTITTTGTCTQKTATGTITVNPDATIALISPVATLVQTVCVNTAITNITYSITGGGAGANITGLPAGVTAVYNAGVFTISGTATVPGTFNYAITTTGTCIQVTAAGIITVNPNVLPTISVAASPSGIFCAGTSITFTATITNGGTAPLYQWKKNGINVGSNASTYTDNTLATTDVITCTLTSNAPCVNPASVTSNPVSVTIGGPISQVTGNSIAIADGDITPAITDNTDFGNVNTNSTVTNTFTIKNTGLTNLVISTITVSGADASLFTIGALTPASPIAPSGSATFTVSFSPTSAGLKTAIVNINNNSCSASLYDFAVQGNGIALPASALDFDGVNDYVSIPHNAKLKPTAQITIEAWVNPRDIHTNTYYEVYRKEDGNGRHLFSFQEHGTILSFGLGVGATYVELDVPINKADYENQWVHIAATYDGKTKRIFRNGVLIGSINTTGAIIATGTSPVLIGQNQQQPEYFNGKIDEVRLWGRALCQTEIQQTMNCELTGPQNGLIAYYKFNQGLAGVPNPSVTTLLDASGNNLNGTLMNFALTSSTSNWVTPGGVVTGVSCSPAQFVLLTPAVVISSNPVSPVCQGTAVTFTATPTNGGTAPAYIWKKNGVTISGATSATYSTNTLVNSDDIACVLTSSETCVTTPTATSNTLQMVVNPPTVPIFAAVASVCQNVTAPVLPTTSTNGIMGTWSPAVSTAMIGATTYTFTPATGQCGTTTTLQITVNAPIVPTFAPVAAVCQNSTAPVLPTTSTNGITGTWSPTVSTATAGTATYTFTPLTGQCATTTNISITINPLPSLTVNPLTAAVCLGNSITLQAASNGTVQWQGFAAGMDNISVTPVANGSYQAIATSALSCTNTASSAINVQASFDLTITATPNPATKGEHIKFTTSSSVPYQIIEWQPSGLFANQTANTQTIIANTNGDYYAIAKTPAGCIDTAHIDIEVITINNDLFIPNFFTPNNDGKNDVLKVYGTSIKNVEMRVFNQWGELVFETRDKDNGWDGTQAGKQQPIGVYIYVAKITLINGRVDTKKGSVTLIR